MACLIFGGIAWAKNWKFASSKGLSSPSSYADAKPGHSQRPWSTHWTEHTPECCVRPSTFTGPATLPTRSYGDLLHVSNTIAARRLLYPLAGHCIRYPELSAQPLVLWEPSHGRRGRGRPKATYVDTMKRDTGARWSWPHWWGIGASGTDTWLVADRRPSSSSSSIKLFVSLYLTLDRSMWYICLNGETEQSVDLIEIFLLTVVTAWLFECLFVFLF